MVKKRFTKIKRIIDRLKQLFTSRGVDKGIYISVFILAVFGIIMIGSASIGSVTSSEKTVTLAIKNMSTQTVYVIAGAAVMIFIARVFKTRYIDYTTSMKLYLLGIILMTICRFWSDSHGSHAWIKFGGAFSIQPAEFMKIAMILIMSYFLTESDKAFVVKGRFKTAALKAAFYKEKFLKCVFLPMLLVFIAAVVGVFIQKDFGTTVILVGICFVCFIGTPRQYFKKYKKMVWIFIGVCAVILTIIGTTVLQPYQLGRIYSWLDPMSDPYNSSYQLVNALIAFSDGGLFGLGFGNSTQKYGYIPESHNDFIGAIIYEELGIIGLGLVIIPTCVVIFKLLKYSNEVKENKSRIILLGVSSYFFLHLIINLGGVSGLIPMTGVPLLLISAGGSSTVSAFVAIGIAQAIIAKHNRQKFDTD
nr:FtsW/RodA/SpoVE family cell cycle protein [Thomasclavelia saccharogumia]